MANSSLVNTGNRSTRRFGLTLVLGLFLVAQVVSEITGAGIL